MSDEIENLEPELKVQKRKKKFNWFGLIIVSLLVIGGLVLLFMIVPPPPSGTLPPGTIDPKNPKPPEQPQEKPKVKVYKVSKENFVHEMPTLGTIQAKSKVDLRFEVNGVVDIVNVKEGDQVRADDTVAELTHGDAELKVEFRKSKLKEAQIELKSAQAKEQQALALLQARAITQAKYDEAKSAVERAEQAVKSAKIELKSGEAELEKTYLKTPIEGMVGQVKVQKGEFVTSQSMVLSVMELAEVNCEFSVLEKDIQQVKEGLEITLSVDSYPGSKFKGSVISLGATVETTEGRARKVKALVTNSDDKNKLMPGMFAQVSIVLFQQEDALTVPMSSFQDFAQDATHVWIVDNNKALKREISVPNASPEKALVDSGLKVGDLVVVDAAALKLQENQEVEVVEVKENSNKINK